MDIDSDSARGPSLYINTNKTSLERGKFDQGYFIPWPNEETMNLPYWLINHMMEFNKKYDPSPKPISLAYEGESHRAKETRFLYGFNDDANILNQYPFVTPLFRDLTKDSKYSVSPSKIVFDKDGNEITPPLNRKKIADLLNAVAIEAERRLKEEGYPDSLSSMTDSTGQVIYDVHTLRVTGVSRLMATGVPIEVIRDVVGHAVNVMTYYYTVLDQLKIMQKLRDGLKLDFNHFGPADIGDDSLINRLIPNTLVDETATVQYGGWVERNGGICPSGVCDEGGPAVIDDADNTTSFAPVPGGAYRCGNCRLWMTGPRYILQQVYYIDLLMNEIVNIHDDRISIYESKLAADTELETYRRNKLKAPQSLLAKVSEHKANITQLTEKLSYLWMEWRNRYHILEVSISSLDEYRDGIKGGSLILFTGQDPLDIKIERHAGSKFGLKRAVANSIIYNMPVSHEVSSTLNNLERDLTKIQLYMSSNDGTPVSLSQIMDDDLRNRAIALHAQHLYLLMNNEYGDSDKHIDKIMSEINGSIPALEDKEYSVLKQWNKAIDESLRDMIQIPEQSQNIKRIKL